MLEHAVPNDPGVDLRRTLRPLLGRFGDDGWWYASRTPDGPATIRVSRDRRHILGRAWGPGAEHLLARLPTLTGLDDRPGLATSHPIVSELHRRNPGLRFGATNDVFPPLAVAVLGQKVTRTEAARAWRGLLDKFSEPAPGPWEQLRLPPDPMRIAAAPYWSFHELHLEKKRADTLRRVASESERINQLAAVSVGEASQWLRSVRGVGEWTVANTIEISHGDPDQVAVGDFHLKNLVAHHLAGRARGTDEEMLELLEEFRPERGRVVRLLHTLGHAPKFGPRSAPRDITRF